MSQLVNYSIIEAGLRALADKAHESAVAQAEGNCLSLAVCLKEIWNWWHFLLP